MLPPYQHVLADIPDGMNKKTGVLAYVRLMIMNLSVAWVATGMIMEIRVIILLLNVAAGYCMKRELTIT